MLKSKKTSITLGIDPGLANTGWGLVKKQGGKLTMIDYGSIKTLASTPTEKRLMEIYQSLDKIIKKYQPDITSIEQLFFCKNVKTAMAVGQARGVIILVAGKNKLQIEEFTPLQIKLALTNYGQASKKQVQQMVKIVLALKTAPSPDHAADALAAAICCINSLKYERKN